MKRSRLARYKARRAMKLYNKYAVKYYGSIENAVLDSLSDTDQMIHGFLSDPSQREIARALNIPKSTVADAVKRLRNVGLSKGAWKLEARG